MRPFKWLIDVLNRTSWWVLIGGGILLVALFGLLAVPLTRFDYEGIGAEAQEVVSRELKISFSREAAKTAARNFARVRTGTPEDTEALINSAFNDLADAQLEIRSATAALATAKSPQEKQEAKEALESANKYKDATMVRIGHVMQEVFGSSDFRFTDDDSDRKKSDGSKDDAPASEPATSPAPPAPPAKAPTSPQPAGARAEAVKKPPQAPQAPQTPQPPAQAQKPRVDAKSQSNSNKFTLDIEEQKNGVTITADKDGAKSEKPVFKLDVKEKPGGVTFNFDFDDELKKADSQLQGEQKKLNAEQKKLKDAVAQSDRDEARRIRELQTKAQNELEDTQPGRLYMRVRGSKVALASDGQFTTDQRAALDRSVQFDLAKIVFSVIMIPITLLLFLLLAVIKFYAGRAKAAQRVAEVSQEEAERTRLREQITQARLQALQAQVEPHFLYNTLANVQALTEIDPPAAGKMVGHLIEYLRAALPKMRESSSTIGQELELARAFLNILQMRMGKRLSFEIAVPQAMLSLPFPPMMLPSLVENAIKHGLEPQREGGSLVITAMVVSSVSGDRIRLSVSDTGKGLSEGKAATAGTGVGVNNIRERLAGLFGEQASLTLEANSPQGVVATIELPAVGATAPANAATVTASHRSGAAMDQPIAAKTGVLASKPIGWWGKTKYVVAWCDYYWRKLMSFLFIMLVVASAIFCLAMLWQIATGAGDINLGSFAASGTGWAFAIGIVVMIAAFVALVIASALIVMIVYAIGWLMVAVAIFTVLSSLSPLLIPLAIIAACWYGYKQYVQGKVAANNRAAEAAKANQ